MADDLLTKDLIQYDPLSETTRKERTSLLGLSMLGLALVMVPLVPEKFAALGVEFAKVNQSTFVKLYALVIVYYMVAFTLYALTDYVAWRRQEVITATEYEFQRQARTPTERRPEGLDDLLKPPAVKVSVRRPVREVPAYTGAASYWLANAATRVRAMFEFLLPFCFGGYALYALLTYAPKP
jgi:hypothetical protein